MDNVVLETDWNLRLYTNIVEGHVVSYLKDIGLLQVTLPASYKVRTYICSSYLGFLEHS